mgnify:FL=1
MGQYLRGMIFDAVKRVPLYRGSQGKTLIPLRQKNCLARSNFEEDQDCSSPLLLPLELVNRHQHMWIQVVDNLFVPPSIGMQPIFIVELSYSGHLLKEERHIDQIELFGDVGIDGIERQGIGRTEISDHLHAGKHYHHPTFLKNSDNLPDIFGRYRWIDTA